MASALANLDWVDVLETGVGLGDVGNLQLSKGSNSKMALPVMHKDIPDWSRLSSNLFNHIYREMLKTCDDESTMPRMVREYVHLNANHMNEEWVDETDSSGCLIRAQIYSGLLGVFGRQYKSVNVMDLEFELVENEVVLQFGGVKSKYLAMYASQCTTGFCNLFDMLTIKSHEKIISKEKMVRYIDMIWNLTRDNLWAVAAKLEQLILGCIIFKNDKHCDLLWRWANGFQAFEIGHSKTWEEVKGQEWDSKITANHPCHGVVSFVMSLELWEIAQLNSLDYLFPPAAIKETEGIEDWKVNMRKNIDGDLSGFFWNQVVENGSVDSKLEELLEIFGYMKMDMLRRCLINDVRKYPYSLTDFVTKVETNLIMYCDDTIGNFKLTKSVKAKIDKKLKKIDDLWSLLSRGEPLGLNTLEEWKLLMWLVPLYQIGNIVTDIPLETFIADKKVVVSGKKEDLVKAMMTSNLKTVGDVLSNCPGRLKAKCKASTTVKDGIVDRKDGLVWHMDWKMDEYKEMGRGFILMDIDSRLIGSICQDWVARKVLGMFPEITIVDSRMSVLGKATSIGYYIESANGYVLNLDMSKFCTRMQNCYVWMIYKMMNELSGSDIFDCVLLAHNNVVVKRGKVMIGPLIGSAEGERAKEWSMMMAMIIKLAFEKHGLYTKSTMAGDNVVTFAGQRKVGDPWNKFVQSIVELERLLTRVGWIMKPDETWVSKTTYVYQKKIYSNGLLYPPIWKTVLPVGVDAESPAADLQTGISNLTSAVSSCVECFNSLERPTKLYARRCIAFAGFIKAITDYIPTGDWVEKMKTFNVENPHMKKRFDEFDDSDYDWEEDDDYDEGEEKSAKWEMVLNNIKKMNWKGAELSEILSIMLFSNSELIGVPSFYAPLQFIGGDRDKLSICCNKARWGRIMGLDYQCLYRYENSKTTDVSLLIEDLKAINVVKKASVIEALKRTVAECVMNMSNSRMLKQRVELDDREKGVIKTMIEKSKPTAGKIMRAMNSFRLSSIDGQLVKSYTTARCMYKYLNDRDYSILGRCVQIAYHVGLWNIMNVMKDGSVISLETTGYLTAKKLRQTTWGFELADITRCDMLEAIVVFKGDDERFLNEKYLINMHRVLEGDRWSKIPNMGYIAKTTRKLNHGMKGMKEDLNGYESKIFDLLPLLWSGCKDKELVRKTLLRYVNMSEADTEAMMKIVMNAKSGSAVHRGADEEQTTSNRTRQDISRLYQLSLCSIDGFHSISDRNLNMQALLLCCDYLTNNREITSLGNSYLMAFRPDGNCEDVVISCTDLLKNTNECKTEFKKKSLVLDDFTRTIIDDGKFFASCYGFWMRGGLGSVSNYKELALIKVIRVLLVFAFLDSKTYSTWGLTMKSLLVKIAQMIEPSLQFEKNIIMMSKLGLWRPQEFPYSRATRERCALALIYTIWNSLIVSNDNRDLVFDLGFDIGKVAIPIGAKRLRPWLAMLRSDGDELVFNSQILYDIQTSGILLEDSGYYLNEVDLVMSVETVRIETPPEDFFQLMRISGTPMNHMRLAMAIGDGDWELPNYRLIAFGDGTLRNSMELVNRIPNKGEIFVFGLNRRELDKLSLDNLDLPYRHTKPDENKKNVGLANKRVIKLDWNMMNKRFFLSQPIDFTKPTEILKKAVKDSFRTRLKVIIVWDAECERPERFKQFWDFIVSEAPRDAIIVCKDYKCVFDTTSFNVVNQSLYGKVTYRWLFKNVPMNDWRNQFIMRNQDIIYIMVDKLIKGIEFKNMSEDAFSDLLRSRNSMRTIFSLGKKLMRSTPIGVLRKQMLRNWVIANGYPEKFWRLDFENKRYIVKKSDVYFANSMWVDSSKLADSIDFSFVNKSGIENWRINESDNMSWINKLRDDDHLGDFDNDDFLDNLKRYFEPAPVQGNEEFIIMDDED